MQTRSDKAGKRIKYTTVHIPNALAALIDNLIESGEFAFSSRSEFVKDALRRFLEFHGYYPQAGLSLEKTKITLNPALLDEEADKMIAELNSKIKTFQELKNVFVKERNKNSQ
jgi:Arc/MetJ-type ribon-helix-helix transcriptional regulator